MSYKYKDDKIPAQCYVNNVKTNKMQRNDRKLGRSGLAGGWKRNV
jgi:hypothetical protein